MGFLNNFKQYNEKVAISEYEDIQNSILDRISSKGIMSLSRLDKELLRAISKEDLDYIRNFKKRGDSYSEILSGDLREDYPDMPMTDDELVDFNVETLWEFIEEIDLDHFTTNYDYPNTVADLTWDDLPNNIKKDFKKYVDKFR